MDCVHTNALYSKHQKLLLLFVFVPLAFQWPLVSSCNFYTFSHTFGYVLRCFRRLHRSIHQESPPLSAFGLARDPFFDSTGWLRRVVVTCDWSQTASCGCEFHRDMMYLYDLYVKITSRDIHSTFLQASLIIAWFGFTQLSLVFHSCCLNVRECLHQSGYVAFLLVAFFRANNLGSCRTQEQEQEQQQKQKKEGRRRTTTTS